MRVQKYLSQMGVTSRREAENWIRQGRLAINGEQIDQLGTQIDPTEDSLTLDGQALQIKEPPRVYWMLHKPDQFLTSSQSQGDKPTIYDLPQLAKLPFKVKPVGRLDFRTEGLLLLSNDGEFIHRLTHPRFKVPRHYYVLVSGKLTEEQLRQIRQSVPLEDGPTRDIEINYAHGKNLGASRGSWYIISVKEGRNRLVRRVFEHFDCKVIRLIRYGMGPVRLPEELKVGEYRQLDAKELRNLRSLVQL